MNEALNRDHIEQASKPRYGKVMAPERLSPRAKVKRHPTSLRAAINAKCYYCCGNQRLEVTLCAMTDCPLWNVRPWQRTKPANTGRIQEL
jgi:hypothetical protein